LDFGAALGFAAGAAPFALVPGLRDAVVLRLPLPAGRLAVLRRVAGAAGFFAAGFRAGRFFAADLPLLAAGDLRAGFTCFFTMMILVR
jgi:hypothetical protein